MLRKCTIFILFVIFSVFTTAAPPAGYYDSAAGLSGSALKTALYDIINGHTSVSYDSLWTHFQATDKKVNGKVWDMYSDIPGDTPPYEYTFVTDQCGAYGGEGDCYNREHSFPSSWFNDASPMVSDLFQLYPTDGYVNGMRANYAFGETISPSWTSLNGSKRGNCTYPGYTGVIFEPRDDYKGDFARAVFYMVTRYENLVAGWETNDANGDAVLDGTAYPALETWAVNMLIEWHANDPVSQKELDRNDAVYSIQSNRNPFIDNPQYVCDIWGGDCGLCDLADTSAPDWSPSGTSGLIALSLNEQIELDWSNASDPDNSITYSVYRSTTSSFTPDAGNLVISGLADSAYIDMGLTNGVTYYYRVAVINCVPLSTMGSEEASAAPSASEGAYGTDLIISEVCDHQSNYQARYVEIYNPTASEISMSGYVIRIYANGATTPNSSFNFSGTIASGEAKVVTYSLTEFNTVFGLTADWASGAISGNGDDVYELVNGVTPIDVYGVIGVDGTGQPWEYLDDVATRESTVCEGNLTWTASEWSITVGTNDCTPQMHSCGCPSAGDSCDTDDLTAPDWTPSGDSGITVTDLQSSGALSISWDTAADTENSGSIRYAIFRSTMDAFTPAVSNMIDTGILMTSYNDTGLENGSTYYYSVQAYNCAALQSSNTDEDSGVPTNPASAPNLLNAIAGDELVSLDWSGVAGSDYYRVFYSLSSSGPYTLLAEITDRNYTHFGVSNGTAYYYVIQNYDSYKYPPESPYSNEMSSTPSVSFADGLDIKNWKLVQYESSQTYTFTIDAKLPVDKYLIVGRNADRAAFETHWSITLPADCIYINSGNRIPLINGGEYFQLLDMNNVSIDDPAGQALKNGLTVQRNNPGDDPVSAASWTTGTYSVADPGAGVGTLSDAGLIINEFSDAADYSYEFVELYNDTAFPFGMDSVHATSPNRVIVDFSHAAQVASGTNISNYSLYVTSSPTTTVTISAIELSSDQEQGIFTTGAMTSGIDYTLEIIGNVLDTNGHSTSPYYSTRRFIAPSSLSTGTNPILFPEWSNDGTKIAYIIYDRATGRSNIWTQNRDGSNALQITSDSDNVFHGGQMTFSWDDTAIAFTADAGGYTQLRKIPSDGSVSSIHFEPTSLTGWGRWTDPHWASNVNQSNGTEQVVVSISGDLWIFDPVQITENDSSLQRLTELTAGYTATYETSDKLLQPKWSPDNSTITFVRRFAGTGAVASEIYILKNVQDKISSQTVVSGWGDADLVQITGNGNPTWSPSISVDSSQVSYSDDINGLFDNISFWSDPHAALSTVQFDAFYESTLGNDLVAKVLENTPSTEAFVKWAPAGGDQFIYTVRSDAGEYNLSVINISVETGFAKSGAFRVQDHSLSYVELMDDSPILPLSIETPLHIPSIQDNFKYIGEARTIKIGGSTNVYISGSISIHYMNSEIRTVDTKDLVLLHFDENMMQWQIIPSTLSKDALGGNITGRIEVSGLYAIAASNIKSYVLEKPRVFPNPYSTVNAVANDPVILEIPLSIHRVSIYNISGEMVLNEALPGSSSIYSFDPDELSSGVYLAIIEDIEGKKVTIKFALIK